jgi:hypothetical protein
MKTRTIKTQPFTVIGFWPDTNNRFAETFEAKTAAAAERICAMTNPGLAICGTIKGAARAADRKSQVTFTA